MKGFVVSAIFQQKASQLMLLEKFRWKLHFFYKHFNNVLSQKKSFDAKQLREQNFCPKNLQRKFFRKFRNMLFLPQNFTSVPSKSFVGYLVLPQRLPTSATLVNSTHITYRFPMSLCAKKGQQKKVKKTCSRLYALMFVFSRHTRENKWSATIIYQTFAWF